MENNRTSCRTGDRLLPGGAPDPGAVSGDSSETPRHAWPRGDSLEPPFTPSQSHLRSYVRGGSPQTALESSAPTRSLGSGAHLELSTADIGAALRDPERPPGTAAPPALHVREYTAADLPMVQEWWRAHNEHELSAALLPPLGVVVEDTGGAPVAALWLYMAVDVGVCFAEHAVTRPGLSIRQSRDALGAALGALEAAARTNDYGVMICNTLPSIARFMKHFGFHADPRPKTSMTKLIKHG